MPIRRVLDAATVVVAVVLAGAFAAAVAVPAVVGWLPLTVLSGSMEPTIGTGSAVIAEPVTGREDAERIKVGDVVTFMPYPDDPTLITHRVTAVTASTAGPMFTTQGDALEQADDWAVTTTQLRGLVRYHVPLMGYALNLLDADLKGWLRWGAIAGAVGYAAGQIVLSVRDRSRHKAAAVAVQ